MHTLGNTLREYGIGWGEVIRRVCFMLLTLGLAGIILGVGQQSAPNPDLINILFVGAFLLGAFAFTIYPILVVLMQNPRLRIHERGVSLTTRGGEQSWRWDEFTLFKGLFTNYRLFGFIPLLQTGAHHFYVGDKKVITLTQLLDKPEDIYTLLATNISKAMLPAFIRSYDRGDTLPFGSITVAKTGVIVGKDTIPVNDVKAVSTTPGKLLLQRRSTKIPTQIQLADSPNPAVLVAMLRYIAQGGKS